MSISIEELISGLTAPNNKFAYECLQQLELISAESNSIYPYFDTFAEMLSNSNSYVRTRGIVLIAANAKWDTAYKIDEVIDQFVKHITDDKPITARQCIKALPTIAKHKPDLKEYIHMALSKTHPQIYKGSMQPLIVQDIQDALQKIAAL